jgi:hypothetical protein
VQPHARQGHGFLNSLLFNIKHDLTKVAKFNPKLQIIQF